MCKLGAYSVSLMQYNKPFLTYSQQLELLKARGLKGDDEAILRALKLIGYYRLSGYTLHFRKDDEFKQDTSIHTIVDVYNFDAELRRVLFKWIEFIEVYLKTQLAYNLGEKTAIPFLTKDNFQKLDNRDYDRLINKCEECFDRSKEPYIKHFKANYSTDVKQLAPWVLVNIIDFGAMVTMYRGANPNIIRGVTEQLEIQFKVLKSWLLSLNTLRNMCAHNDRLWGRKIPTAPIMPRRLSNQPFALASVEQYIIIIQDILQHIGVLKGSTSTETLINSLVGWWDNIYLWGVKHYDKTFDDEIKGER